MRPGHLTLLIAPLTMIGLLAPAWVQSIADVRAGRSTVGTPPRGGNCPVGSHLVHSTGEAGIVDPDTVVYRDADYECVPDDAPTAVRCGPHGRPVLVNGVAACACADGYGGRTCQLCASGHVRGRGGRCVLAARPRFTIEGTGGALEQGQELTLAARRDRAGAAAGRLRWRIKAGEGCLRSIDPGPRDERGDRPDCSRTAWGEQVVFRAPTFGDTVEMTAIEAQPVGPDGGPAAEIPIAYVAPGSIPVSGSGDFHLLPIVSALVDFMKHRCVGAAVLGVARHGQPLGTWGLGRMNGRGSLSADPGCGTNAENPFDPFADNVGPDAPLLLGSVSKAITAAVLRWTLKTAWADLDPGVAPTDADLEGLPLFGPSAFPASLFPQPLADLYAGLTVPPVFFPDSLSYDSEDSFPLCPDLTTAADPKWAQATLGHSLAHRAGLQRSAIDFGPVTANLAAIRPIPDEAAFQAEEQLLVDQYGAAVVAAAKAALGGGTVYFVPRPTVGEILTAVAGRCTRFPLGTYNYSNTDPAYWTTIIEQLTPSGRFAASIGDPASHQDSALQLFFESQLTVPTTGTSGIFRQQGAIGLPASAYAGPEKRGWSQSQGTYYPVDWDDKRPHCTWADDACDFQDWLDANPGRTNWAWGLDQVLFPYAGGGVGAGTGGLAAAPLAMLRFMASYWIGGYGSDPKIGEPRDNVWTVSTSHNGSLGGGFAYGLQYGPDAVSQWNFPPIAPSGHVLDDFDNLVPYLCELPGNDVPDGIDVFVAVNQRTDKKCTDSAALGGYTCSDAYGLLHSFVKFGICRVQNWDLVTPP